MHTFSRKVVYNIYRNFACLIYIACIDQWLVTRSTLGGGLVCFEKFRSLRLQKFAIRIVVFIRDTVLVHQVVVVQLTSRVHGEASTISHSKSLRHLLLHQKLICLFTIVRFHEFIFMLFNFCTISFMFAPDNVSKISNFSDGTLFTLMLGSVFMC